MTKQEAIQKLEDTEKELAKLRAIIEAQESSQWKPGLGKTMYSVNLVGKVYKAKYLEIPLQDERIYVGNCFKTRIEAENSLKCTIMSSEYDYWIPGVSTCGPGSPPKNHEYYSTQYGEWLRGTDPYTGQWLSNTRRWKRSEQ